MRPGLAFLTAAMLAGCTFAAVPPSGAPTLAATPTPSTVVRASATATAAPTASPTPSPAPTPDPAAMALEVTSCNGGTVLRWSPSRHPDFHHYIGLRSPEEEIAPQYPPIAPAVDWGDLYASDRFVTSGHDATVVPSDTEWHYLVVGYDAAGRPVSRSNVASGRILPHRQLGAVEAEVLPDGAVRLTWDAFDGVDGCFSAYRVLHGTGGVAGTLLTTITDLERTTLETRALHPGTTYVLRVHAVRTTTLGHFVVAESEPLTFSVPVP
jgi:hypothetical protein